jgi:RNA polymerase sigma factor (sigma-70 family)
MDVTPTETPTGGRSWSQALETNPWRPGASQRRGTDEQLARAAARGDVAAFEALYERHHRALLSFSRHMLGSAHDAEDVVQHAFLAADREFRSGKPPKAVRAWLYTVARNRCVSIVRARHDEPGLPDAGMPSTENLAAEVEQREDLRGLLADLRELPDDQRTALLLSEMGELSHPEVAKVIGVRPGKVKALVYQARETLMAFAHARAIPCQSIREELAVAKGAELRRRHLRNHLSRCPGCSEFAAGVRAQRASLTIVLPVVPTAALREGVIGALAGGSASAAAGAGAGVGLLAAKTTAAKLLAIAAVGGTAATGVTAIDGPDPPRASERRAEPATATRPATTTPTPAATRSPSTTTLTPAATGSPVIAGRDRRPAAEGRDRERAQRHTPPGQAKQAERGEPPGHTKQAERGEPPGHTRQAARGEPPGRRTEPPGHAKQAERAAPPGQAKQADPAPNPKPRAAPPGQAKQTEPAAPPTPAPPSPKSRAAAPSDVPAADPTPRKAG